MLDTLDAVLAPSLYPPREDGTDPRVCPLCGNGQLHLKTSKSGGFVGCGNYPECRYTRPIGGESENGDRVLGEDNGDEISLRSGRFGPYVQRGEPTEDVKKPPRASLPKGWTQEDMTLEKALTLLSLPRFVGDHPDGGQIHTNIGRYGPYVMHTTADDEGKEAKLYANIPDVEEVFTIGMNRAVEVIAEKRTKGGGRGRAAAKPLKELGEHPTEGGPVNVMDGRYGPYVKWEKVNATIPKETEPADVTMEQAVELITARAAKKGGRKKAAPKKKTATKKKPAAKKKTPVKKKPAAKKV